MTLETRFTDGVKRDWTEALAWSWAERSGDKCCRWVWWTLKENPQKNTALESTFSTSCWSDLQLVRGPLLFHHVRPAKGLAVLFLFKLLRILNWWSVVSSACWFFELQRLRLFLPLTLKGWRISEQRCCKRKHVDSLIRSPRHCEGRDFSRPTIVLLQSDICCGSSDVYWSWLQYMSTTRHLSIPRGWISLTLVMLWVFFLSHQQVKCGYESFLDN